MINNGRDFVIDAIKFDPDRIEIHYHKAADDVLVGGMPVLVSTIYVRLIMNELAADDIDDMQDSASDLLEKTFRWEREAQRLREATQQQGDEDD